MANYSYLIGSLSSKEVVLIDPAWEVVKLLGIAEKDGMNLIGVLATHTHADHIGGSLMGHQIEGVADLLEQCPSKVYIHKNEAEFAPVPSSEIVKTDGHTQLEMGGVKIEFIHTPGHSPGSQCFMVEGRLCSGDTLFINSCGRTDLEGGDAGDLYLSLTEKLMKLDGGTLVFPGHQNTISETHSTIAGEQAENPYLQFPDKESFLAAVGAP